MWTNDNLDQRRLATNVVIGFSLLKRGVAPKLVSSLSFQVRIPISVREKALAEETWPAGVR